MKSIKGRLAFVLVSGCYRQMFANSGIATDSARVAPSTQWARLSGTVTRRPFVAPPMPQLQTPTPRTMSIRLLEIARH